MKTPLAGIGFALALASLVCACKPSPDEIVLRSRTTQSIAGRVEVLEGDVLAILAAPKDDEADMKLCVTATSSNPAALEVRPVKGDCRQFVVSALAPADSVTLQFSARDEVQELIVTVRPSP